MFWEEKLGKINARDVNDLTFECYWKQLQLRVWRYVMSITGIEIPYRAFPEQVASRTQSPESVDYFGTID